MKEPQFIMHDANDSCAVCVVENVKANAKVDCWVQEDDSSLEFQMSTDIKIGHKVAAKDIAIGDDIIKYGVVIGKCIQSIKVGEHLHVHNTKTKRW